MSQREACRACLYLVAISQGIATELSRIACLCCCAVRIRTLFASWLVVIIAHSQEGCHITVASTVALHSAAVLNRLFLQFLAETNISPAPKHREQGLSLAISAAAAAAAAGLTQLHTS